LLINGGERVAQTVGSVLLHLDPQLLHAHAYRKSHIRTHARTHARTHTHTHTHTHTNTHTHTHTPVHTLIADDAQNRRDAHGGQRTKRKTLHAQASKSHSPVHSRAHTGANTCTTLFTPPHRPTRAGRGIDPHTDKPQIHSRREQRPRPSAARRRYWSGQFPPTRNCTLYRSPHQIPPTHLHRPPPVLPCCRLHCLCRYPKGNLKGGACDG